MNSAAITYTFWSSKREFFRLQLSFISSLHSKRLLSSRWDSAPATLHFPPATFFNLKTLLKVVFLSFFAAKFLPVAYGIQKIQISCVVEDDKIGTDFLEEKITEFEDYVSTKSRLH